MSGRAKPAGGAGKPKPAGGAGKPKGRLSKPKGRLSKPPPTIAKVIAAATAEVASRELGVTVSKKEASKIEKSLRTQIKDTGKPLSISVKIKKAPLFIPPPLDLAADVINKINGTSGHAPIILGAAWPTQISQVFDRIPLAPGDNDTRMVSWLTRLMYFGNVTDTMIARGGDLVHDIGPAVTTPIRGGPTMIDFLNDYPRINGMGARILGYVTRIPQIMRDFNAFRRSQFSPRIVHRTELGTLTTDLLANGVNHIIYDSGFGNIFEAGFGRGMTYINGSVSEIDGASKIGPDKLAAYGINPRNEYTPFSLPYFYGNTVHTITLDPDRMRQVTVAIGAQNVTLQCMSGISVNALCNLVGIPPPRGSGEAGSPVTIVGAPTLPGAEYHSVLVKPMTDWGQLVYALLLTYLGILCVFVTNDEYCLALGAALGLPYMIRTPFTGADYVEFYDFDPSIGGLTAANEAAIRAALSAPIPPDSPIRDSMREFYQARERAIRCMQLNNVPQILIIQFTTDYNTAGSELNAIVANFVPATVAALTTAQLSRFRSLLPGGITREAYLEAEMAQRVATIYTKYVSFGVSITTELHTKLIWDPTAIGRVVNIIRGMVGLDQPNIMAVFNSFRDRDARIVYYGDIPDRTWRNYYDILLKRAFNLADDSPRLFNPGAGGIQEWTNPGLSMKRAMWEIVRNTSVARSMPSPSTPCDVAVMAAVDATAPAGIAQFIQAGGDSESEQYLPDGTYPISEESREYVEEMRAFIEARHSEAQYKPSCSKINTVLAAAPLSFASTQEKVRWIIEAIRLLEIDAYESNMAPDFEILMSNIEDIYNLLVADQITPTEMREQLEYILCLHDVIVPIIDGISPDNQRLLFRIIQSIDDPSANLRQVESNFEAARARGNTQTMLGLANTLRRARRTENGPAAPILSPPKPGMMTMQNIWKRNAAAAQEAAAPGTVGIPQLVTVAGGARRSHRRRRSTPRRITRNKKRDHASRRRRTIRRRK